MRAVGKCKGAEHSHTYHEHHELPRFQAVPIEIDTLQALAAPQDHRQMQVPLGILVQLDHRHLSTFHTQMHSKVLPKSEAGFPKPLATYTVDLQPLLAPPMAQDLLFPGKSSFLN